jgi:hypothetical protein
MPCIEIILFQNLYYTFASDWISESLAILIVIYAYVRKTKSYK